MRVRPPVRRRQRYRYRYRRRRRRRRIFKHRQNTSTVLYSLMYLRLLYTTSSSSLGTTNIIIPRAEGTYTRFLHPPSRPSYSVGGAKMCTNGSARAHPDTADVGRLSQSHPKSQWVRESTVFSKRARFPSFPTIQFSKLYLADGVYGQIVVVSHHYLIFTITETLILIRLHIIII